MAANNVPSCEPMFWVYLVTSMTLVAFAGLMSGLTLGLMSLSLVDLEVLTKAGLPQDQKNAAKILPIVKNQHLLLCTLLICNALAMEALPIFLDALLPAWGAILISVTLILAFGEIIPQAVCSRYGLSVGAKLSVVVRLLVIVVFPISYPISKLLDFLLGKEHSALLRRAELKTLVHMHGNEAGRGGELTRDETTIISGALELTQKIVKDVMTPIKEIFALDLNSKLNEETRSLIISKGHSRVPVYSGRPTNIVGLILVKNLIKCHHEDETPIRNLTIRRIPRVYDGLPLFDILNQFQKGHSHMAVVVKGKNDVKDTAENVKASEDMIKINIRSHSSIQKQAGEKGFGCQFCPNRQQNICISKYASCVISSDSEGQSPAPEDVVVRGNDLNPQQKQREREYGNMTNDVLEILSDSDEEIIGVITMEDVLEELLQKEILDETDEYVDVHKKIKINMLHSRLSSRSPRAPSTSRMNWRTPVASPLSSGHQTPASPFHHISMLRSPVSPYIQSPIIRPTLYASPGKSIPSSPAGSAARSSPSSYLVSRKSYEKLNKSGYSEGSTLRHDDL